MPVRTSENSSAPSAALSSVAVSCNATVAPEAVPWGRVREPVLGEKSAVASVAEPTLAWVTPLPANTVQPTPTSATNASVLLCEQLATVVAAPSTKSARPATAVQVMVSAASLEAMVTACEPAVVPPLAPLIVPSWRTNTSAPSAAASFRVWTVTVCAVVSVKESGVLEAGKDCSAVLSPAPSVARKSPAAASPVLESASAATDHGTSTVAPPKPPPDGVMVKDCDAPSRISPLAGVARATVNTMGSLSVIWTAAEPAEPDTATLSAAAPVALDKVTVSVSSASFRESSATVKVMVCAVAWLAVVKVRVRPVAG